MPTLRYGSSYSGFTAATRSLPAPASSPGGFGASTGGAANATVVQDEHLGTDNRVNGPTSAQKYLLFYITDSTIPILSTGGSVVIGECADHWLAAGNSLQACKYKSTANNYDTFSISNDPSIDFSIPAYYDGDGSALTGANFQTTAWGVSCKQITSGAAVYVYEVQIAFTFTLPNPTVSTASAVSITGTTARLTGTINPRSATSTYPVNYKFMWGTSPGALTNTETGIANLTGSSPVDVSADLNSLTAGVTYYYELYAWPVGDASPTITAGGVSSFTTIGTASSITTWASF